MNARTIFTKNLRWIDIPEPTAEDIKWLEANFRFHQLHYEAVREKQQRPRLDAGRGYDFLVLLFPVYDQKNQEIVSGEVDFFISQNFVITVHYNQIHTINKIFAAIKNGAGVRAANMQKGSGFLLYKILEGLFQRSYPILDHMNEDIGAIEQGIFRDTGANMLSKIMLMKKNIIEFRKMMKTHRSVLEKLPKRTSEYFNFAQSKLYYRDLLEYYENIWDILEALKETADGLADTNQALVARRLGETTKIISVFSAIVIPATLVAFLFGVSVEGIPFRYNPHGFWLVAILMALASLITLWIFKRNKWF